MAAASFRRKSRRSCDGYANGQRANRQKGRRVTNKWSPERDRLNAATELAETITNSLEIARPPVDPFAVIKSERRLLLAFGEDFGDAFDGRLEYQSPRFLLFYNTKYDALPHSGQHHPRVNFSVAHELGHYFLEQHRQFLKKGGR